MFKDKLAKYTEKIFGLKVLAIDEPKSGYRNKSYKIKLENGNLLNFILFKNEAGIFERMQGANSVGDFLAESGLPSRKSVVMDNGENYCTSHIEHCTLHSPFVVLKNNNGHLRYGCFYEYLPGETIPWEAYTSKHIKNLGGMMGKMHKLIQQFDNSLIRQLPDETNIQLENIERMERYFKDENVLSALNKKLGLELNFDFNGFRKVFKIISSEDKQVLHMDFVRGNVLFSTDKRNCKCENMQICECHNDIYISGILDFEKVSIGPRIVDIARTLAFLLIDCKYMEKAKVRAYFLYNGYQKRGENKLPDLKYLEYLIIYFMVYDFYKFLKRNPYESLPQNEHFIKTRDYLLERKILSR